MSVASSCLCLIADGMDQAKFKLPRVRERKSKLFLRLWRPKLHVAAAWAHGSQICFSISDEDLKKDSATQCEIVARCIDSVLERTQGLPHGLAVQQDNTVREGKNQYFMVFMMMTVALGTFRWANANYLRTGHSAKSDIRFFDYVFQSVALFCSCRTTKYIPF